MIIGEIKTKFNGEVCTAQVTDNCEVIFPDGTTKKLGQAQYEQIKEKLDAQNAAQESAKPEEPKAVPLTLPTQEQPAESEVVKDVLVSEAEKADLPQKEQQVAVDPISPQIDTQPVNPPISERDTNNTDDAKMKSHKTKENKAGNTIATIIVVVITTCVLSCLIVIGVLYSLLGESLISVVKGEISLTPEQAVVETPTEEVMEESIEEEANTSTEEVSLPETIDEAECIMIFARITSPDGEVKDVMLGYFKSEEDTDIAVNEGSIEDSGEMVSNSIYLDENYVSLLQSISW